jgi:putative ABC transport system substrate-binding protein
MRRREFVGLIAGAAQAWPLIARAQRTGKPHRVALILSTSPVSSMTGAEPINPAVRAFVQALRSLGYVEGQSLILEHRSAEGRFERFSEIAAELVGLGVDVIVAGRTDIPNAVARVTRTVPIVMAGSFNPVEAGPVASLAQPGGNITGLTANSGPEIDAKRLQLLKEAVPAVSRIAFLGTKSDWESPEGKSVRAVAPRLGVTLVRAEHTPTDYAGAFALISRERLQAMFVSTDRANFANGQLIANFARDQLLPGRIFLPRNGGGRRATVLQCQPSRPLRPRRWICR